MEAVIFIGIQGSGKSTFYRHRFFDTHLRLSLDMLKTRNRLKLLVQASLEAKQRFVIDNTNVGREERGQYMAMARDAGFKVAGYYFVPEVERALEWNQQRTGKAIVPVKGVMATLKRLDKPELAEGFDELYEVRTPAPGEYQLRALHPPDIS